MFRSIVEYFNDNEGHKCNYCNKNSSRNVSHGMWAHTLTVSDYQQLIDRGWRRSGKYCYKPTMNEACCPMYTIRCNAYDFKLSKSQKKVLKRFNKTLVGKDLSKDKGKGSQRKMSLDSTISTEDIANDNNCGQEQFVETANKHQNIDVNAVIVQHLEEQVQASIDISQEIEVKPGTSSSNAPNSKMKIINKGLGPDPDRAPCKKAKQLRKERKLEKLKEKGADMETLGPNSVINKEKQLEDFINELPPETQHKLQIRLVRTNPQSPEYLATAKITHMVYQRYQMTIHGDRADKCTESKFKEFLVHSPLIEEKHDTGPPSGYGSFHQQYWLDKTLIAVGVIDILPKCVSSVYFFYDPSYLNLTLGTYGALREIGFTRHLTTLAPELKYYYMGYYIHACTKMRYKGNFHPSDLLCPETFKWFPIKDSLLKLEVSPYSRLDSDIDSIDENNPRDEDINFVPVMIKQSVILYKVYRRKSKKDDKEEVIQYAKLVGRKLAKSLILVR